MKDHWKKIEEEDPPLDERLLLYFELTDQDGNKFHRIAIGTLLPCLAEIEWFDDYDAPFVDEPKYWQPLQPPEDKQNDR